MRYSIKLRDRIYVEGYRFSSFAKNIGKNATKVAKSMSNEYSQKLLDRAKKSTTDTIKTASKTLIQKTAEATGNLVGNKIADKITSVSTELYPKSQNELRLKELHLQNNDANNETEVPKERHISPEKNNKLLMN